MSDNHINPDIQLVHESHTQRQYVRVDVPCRARIGGKDYDVMNLSPGGISVQDRDTVHRTGKILDFFLIVPFQSFSIDIPLKGEVQHYNPQSGLLGCRFIELNREKTSILTHIVRGFIAGDMITAGEVLNIVSRDNFARPRGAAGTQSTNMRRQIFFLVFAGCLGLAALYFLAHNFYKNSYNFQSENGVVESESVAVRTSQAGMFQSALSGSAGILKPGQIIGHIVPSILNGEDPRAGIKLTSPCECRIQGGAPGDNKYLDVGQTVVTLIPVDASLWVSVIMKSSDAQRIPMGSAATITIAGSDAHVTGKVARYEASVEDLKAMTAAAALPQGVTIVTIVPDQILPAELRGRPATVSFKL